MTDMTNPDRSGGRIWPVLVMAVVLLGLAPLWVGFVFDRFFGPNFLYLGYGVGFAFGLAAFIGERWLARRKR